LEGVCARRRAQQHKDIVEELCKIRE
jgi:hypothetical protein